MEYQEAPYVTNSDDAANSAALALDAMDPKTLEMLENAARQHASRLEIGEVAPQTASYKVSRYDIPIVLADGGVLLFNSNSRSLILLTEAEAKFYWRLAAVETFAASNVNDRVFLRTLSAGYHVVPANTNELENVRRNYDDARNNQGSLGLTIMPTMSCNFACGYCFQGTHKASKQMPAEIQEALIRFIKSKKDLKSLNITWYGGEPLMGKEAMFRLSDILIAYCDKNKISYSAGIISNSFLLTADIAASLYSRRITWLQVTIDGDRETHNQMRPLTSGQGSYDKIVENIGAALDGTQIKISCRVNVGKRNINKASEMLDALAALNFKTRGNFSVYFSPIEASTPESGVAHSEKLAREEFHRKLLALEEKARKLGFASIPTPPGGFMGLCVAAKNSSYVVAANGDIHKCWETAHDGTKRVGTILEPEHIHCSVTASLWQEWSPFDNPVCSSCKIAPMCAGHCAHRFVYGGVENAALPCPSWKWNTAEYIFSRAVGLGVVTEDKWLLDQATVHAMQSGERHSVETLSAAQEQVLAKVGKLHGLQIDREMIYVGQSVLEKAKKPVSPEPQSAVAQDQI